MQDWDLALKVCPVDGSEGVGSALGSPPSVHLAEAQVVLGYPEVLPLAPAPLPELRQVKHGGWSKDGG